MLLAITANAQYYEGRIRIDSANKSFLFQVTDDTRKASGLQYYYWFKSGHIRVTQGSYYGKLLHGNYKVVDIDKHLLEEGQFKKGIKTGLWRTWYENGNLKSTWQRKHGLFKDRYIIREYDTTGKIIIKRPENNTAGTQDSTSKKSL